MGAEMTCRMSRNSKIGLTIALAINMNLIVSANSWADELTRENANLAELGRSINQSLENDAKQIRMLTSLSRVLPELLSKRKGEESDSLSHLNRWLYEQGLIRVEATKPEFVNRFTSATESALQKLQRKFGLPLTGKVDDETGQIIKQTVDRKLLEIETRLSEPLVQERTPETENDSKSGQSSEPVKLQSKHVFLNESDEINIIGIEGEINELVARDFIIALASLKNKSVIVAINSPGGSVTDGLAIANEIYKNNLAIIPGRTCSSICGIIWLSAKRRHWPDFSSIGFHAAYFENGEVSATGNALIGSFLARIGVQDNVIRYVVNAPPQGMNFLTKEQAYLLGIDYIILPNKGSEAPM